jgi:hypothetical protein
MKMLMMLFLSMNVFASDVDERLEKKYLELADLLATVRLENGVCESDAYQESILAHVISARNHSNDFQSVYQVTPPIQEAMKDSLTFKTSINEMSEHRFTKEDLEKALVGVVFYGPARGAYGNTDILKFNGNGKANLSILHVLNDEPWTRWEEKEVTYTVEVKVERYDRKAYLKLNTGDKEESYIFQYKYNMGAPYWFLAPTDKPDIEQWEGGFSDFPSECDA